MTWPPMFPFDSRPRSKTKEVGSIDLRQIENAEEFFHEVKRVVSLIGNRPHKDISVDYDYDDGCHGFNSSGSVMKISFSYEEVETPAQVQARREEYDAEQARHVASQLARAEEFEREARRLRDEARQTMEKIGK